VQKAPKTIECGTENKGVSGRQDANFWEVLEVAANKEVRGILGRAGVWDDAVRLTEGVVLTTCKSYHMRYVTVNEKIDKKEGGPPTGSERATRSAAPPFQEPNPKR